MLSAETAAGAYPRLAVEAMSRIITEIEQHPPSRQFHDPHEVPSGIVTTEVAIAAATVAAVKMLAAPLVVVITKSGFSARIVSSHRPPVPILALTDNARTCTQLALLWGVIPHVPTHSHLHGDGGGRQGRGARSRACRAVGSGRVHCRPPVRRSRHHQSHEGRGDVTLADARSAVR